MRQVSLIYPGGEIPSPQRPSQPAGIESCVDEFSTKRRQSDRQATTQVKLFSPVTPVMQRPTGSPIGKATVGVGYGDCAGDAAGVEVRGMSGEG